MSVRWHSYPDAAGAAQACARQIVALLDDKLSGNPRATFAVSGGTTPKLLFEELVKLRYDKWDRVHLFFVDERAVPPTDPQSNYKLAEEFLITPAHVPRHNVHRVRGEITPVHAAEHYTDEIREFFELDSGQLPHFDIVQQGMGPEAHTASLFPDDPLLDDREGIAAAVHTPKPRPGESLCCRVSCSPRGTTFSRGREDQRLPCKPSSEANYDPKRLPAQSQSRIPRAVSTGFWTTPRAASCGNQNDRAPAVSIAGRCPLSRPAAYPHHLRHRYRRRHRRRPGSGTRTAIPRARRARRHHRDRRHRIPRAPDLEAAKHLSKAGHPDRYRRLRAAELIVETLLASPRKIRLVPVGPLTNIALALKLEPRIKEKIERIVIMGGAFEMHIPEYNIRRDRIAAEIVFRSGVPVTAVGLDVTTKCKLQATDIERLRKAGNPASALLVRLIELWQDGKHDRFPTLHDPLAVAVTFLPSLVETRLGSVAVETNSPLTNGMTIFTAADQLPKGQSATTRIAVNVDPRAGLSTCSWTACPPRPGQNGMQRVAPTLAAAAFERLLATTPPAARR